jgi:serine protease Do
VEERTVTRTPTSRPNAATSLSRALAVCVLALGLAAVAAGPAAAQPVPSFADLTEKLSPAVVNISTTQTIELPDQEDLPIPKGSPFEDLFRDFFGENGRGGRRKAQSLGSGFVISPEGYVVTNNHVIEEADEITVNFADGRSLPATVVGVDAKTDLALLKIEAAEPLPFVTFGDSDKMRVGDWVLAIGNPFGLGGTVTAGIVSGRNRELNAGPYDDFLQTDAAINQGNSGGPLFNLAGEVVGVNSAIISPSGGSVGLAFSISANLAKGVIEQLQKFGATRRGWLGVRIQTVNEEMAEALGMEKPVGALVADVDPDGPAAAAGIAAGDVILKFDGRDVVEMRDLPRMVAETEVDKTVRVVIFRKGKTQTVTAKVGLLKEEEPAAAPEPEAETVDMLSLGGVGLTLAPLSPEARARFAIADEVTGVVVTDVAGGSPAAEKGVSPGDVIVEVGQEPVTAPAEVEAKVAEAISLGRDKVLLLIQRGDDVRFVALDVGG